MLYLTIFGIVPFSGLTHLNLSRAPLGARTSSCASLN